MFLPDGLDLTGSKVGDGYYPLFGRLIQCNFREKATANPELPIVRQGPKLNFPGKAPENRTVQMVEQVRTADQDPLVVLHLRQQFVGLTDFP